jgi:Fe-S cluster assembly ATP-binding protein
MLSIKNLHAQVEETPILQGINLDIKPGEVHAIMGPNGSGKSTLASVLAGREEYEVTEGSVNFLGEDLLDLDVEERAQNGLFLAFQYPIEIPGVTNATFLRSSINAIRTANGQDELNGAQALKLIREKMAAVEMDASFLKRSLNEGFSGGEKKRNEMLQMMLLEPKLAILDETDSGLDIDALQVVAKAVNSMRNTDRSFLVVTHYQRLLDHIVPDFVHVLYNGRIVRSGDKSLALELEKRGYDWIKEEVAAQTA